MLVKNCFKLISEAQKVVLSKNVMHLGRRYLNKYLFKMNVMIVKCNIKFNKNISSSYLVEHSNLWHVRLGCVNFNIFMKIDKFGFIAFNKS